MTHLIAFLSAALIGAGALYFDALVTVGVFGLGMPFASYFFFAVTIIAFIGLFAQGPKAQTFASVAGIPSGIIGTDYLRNFAFGAEPLLWFWA